MNIIPGAGAALRNLEVAVLKQQLVKDVRRLCQPPQSYLKTIRESMKRPVIPAEEALGGAGHVLGGRGCRPAYIPIY